MANRILLADDSITIQKVVNLTFADEGIEVVAVSNGDQAERRLADVQPDLVLADIFMPGKNGYELCETIKTSPPFQHIPVILLVGAFEPFDQAEAHRVKADAHLTKPFESRTLVDTVRKLISASSGRPRTGPLPVAEAPVEPLTPVMPPVTPPAAPRPTAHMAQPFDLDLPVMSTPSAPSVPGATMPLNYAFESNDAPLAVPIEAPAEANSRRTDDLSFVDNEPPFEAFGLDDLFSEPQGGQAAPNLAASQPVTAVLTETAQESSTRGVPSTFGYAAEEMLLDFDQPAPAMPRPAHEPFAFDIDVREPASVDASGMQPDEPSVEVAAEAEDLKTTLLTQPAPTAPVEPSINTNPLEELHAPAVSAPVEAADLGVDESGLFNLDDPLGDVLDEGTAEAAPVEATAQQASPVDYAVEMPAEPQAAPVVSEVEAPPVEAVASETGFGFTPVEEVTAEPLPHADEAKFTTSSMWSNEGARFAAIDIEATPVDEPAESASQASAEAPETFGFSESASAYTTQPEPVAEVAAPVAEESAPPAAAQATVELSPALMDEIVRRVVAQLSESVVREIAWEVVPDCVERVVKEVTAQEVAKR
ncbi:MAG TPA: response regulator [Blastocatellia bacterium]|nr:response regulator [Blastocatellia bacterium]